MSPNPSTATPASYNPWPHALMGFFALLFAAMAGVVWIVVHQPSELVSRNYYDQEMLYQGRMEAIRRTQGLGREVRVQSEPGRLIVNLPSDQARRGPVGAIHLFRPADARLDREFKLAIDPTGRQIIDLRGLDAGLWRVRMEWAVGTETYYREEALVL